MKSLESLASRFRFNEKAIGATLADFTESDWTHRIHGSTSHAFWLLGHIAASRRGLLRGCGVEKAKATWEASFVRGTHPGAKDGVTPDALVADIAESGDALAARFAAITPEQAEAPYARTFPDGSSTVEGAAHFLFWHETYHLGQLGLLRRACGKAGLA
jgi:hypothetical protein